MERKNGGEEKRGEGRRYISELKADDTEVEKWRRLERKSEEEKREKKREFEDLKRVLINVTRLQVEERRELEERNGGGEKQWR